LVLIGSGSVHPDDLRKARGAPTVITPKYLIFFSPQGVGRFQNGTCFKTKRGGVSRVGFVGDKGLEGESAEENPDSQAQFSVESESREQGKDGVGCHGRSEALHGDFIVKYQFR
jgi:hypothetical protein